MTDFVVIGKSVKVSKVVEGLIPFIKENWNVSGKRLGYDNFVKQFADFNEKKLTVKDVSIPSVKDVRIACLKAAEEIKANATALDVIPVVIINKQSGVTTIETRSVNAFESFYPSSKQTEKKETDYTAWIINAMNKHADKIDLNAIRDALEALAVSVSENAENVNDIKSVENA